MAGKRNQLQEDMHFRVLCILESNPEMSQRDLAEAVGVSVGSAHYCLNALVERGLVKFGNFTASNDKRRYAYVLTPKGLAEKTSLTGRFIKRKLAEFEALKAEIEALRDTMEPNKRSES